jgi:cation transport ATPase
VTLYLGIAASILVSAYALFMNKGIVLVLILCFDKTGTITQNRLSVRYQTKKITAREVHFQKVIALQFTAKEW